MDIHIMPIEQIGKFVTDKVAVQLKQKPNSVLGLTTGKTPLITGIFKEMIQRQNTGEIDFSKSVLINPDEFLGIPKEHPESYHTYARQNLLDHIDHPWEQWYIPDSMTADSEAECDKMEQGIYEAGALIGS